jgi:hypothetical protein
METIAKIAGSSLAALLLIGWVGASHALGASNDTGSAKAILQKDEFVPSGYCHQKLPAINVNTLAGDHPDLNQTEIIDFSGPCNEDPLGTGQVSDQKRADSDKQSH